MGNAYTVIGNKFLSGNGVPKDINKAIECFRMSAEQGDVEAQYTLGLIFAFGNGVPVDGDEAKLWFRMASEQGYAEAQNKLGLGCFNDNDFTQAHRWFRMAAEQGLAESQYLFGLTDEIVSGDKTKSQKWCRLAAEQGYAEAQYWVGHKYYNSQNDTTDGELAESWFHKAAAQGHAEAQYKLGLIYALGRVGSQNGYKASQWFRQAAEQGHKAAEYNWNLYVNVLGVTEKDPQADKWFRAAEQEKEKNEKAELSSMSKNKLQKIMAFEGAWSRSHHTLDFTLYNIDSRYKKIVEAKSLFFDKILKEMGTRLSQAYR